MSKLVIMRHAESVFGEKKYSGVMDVPLSSKGINQAIDSALVLPEIQFDIVYTSSLIRSLETALIFLAFRKKTKTPVRIGENELEQYLYENQYLPIIEKEELQERQYGVFEGRSKKELESHFDKDTIFKWRRSINQAPPGGESLLNIIEKVIPFFHTELKIRLEQGHNILLVAHQSSIRALYYLLFKPSDIEIETIDFNNTGILYVEYDKGQVRLISSPGLTTEKEAPKKPVDVAVYVSAGGKGSRMKELTENCPKPLIKINKRPLIDYLITFLSKQNIVLHTYVSYGYLKSSWDEYFQKYKKNNVSFIYDSNQINMIYPFLTIANSIKEDILVVISGDMVFNYKIIPEIIAQHINSKNDISVALNTSPNNCYKIWEYILLDGQIVDIIPNSVVTNTERYFFIINKNVLVDYTSNFSTNMGNTSKEFVKYYKYNKGWSCLIKKLIDCNKYNIKAIYLNEEVINVNDSQQLKQAEVFFREN